MKLNNDCKLINRICAVALLTQVSQNYAIQDRKAYLEKMTDSLIDRT